MPTVEGIAVPQPLLTHSTEFYPSNTFHLCIYNLQGTDQCDCRLQIHFYLDTVLVAQHKAVKYSTKTLCAGSCLATSGCRGVRQQPQES